MWYWGICNAGCLWYSVSVILGAGVSVWGVCASWVLWSCKLWVSGSPLMLWGVVSLCNTMESWGMCKVPWHGSAASSEGHGSPPVCRVGCGVSCLQNEVWGSPVCRVGYVDSPVYWVEVLHSHSTPKWAQSRTVEAWYKSTWKCLCMEWGACRKGGGRVVCACTCLWGSCVCCVSVACLSHVYCVYVMCIFRVCYV